MKLYLNWPAVDDCLQDHLDTHRRVRAAVPHRTGVAAFQQHDAKGTSNNARGRKECLVTTAYNHASTKVLDGRPTTALVGTFDKISPLLSILATSATRSRLHHWQVL